MRILFTLVVFLTWILPAALFALLLHVASGSRFAMTIAGVLNRAPIGEKRLGTANPTEKEGPNLVAIDSGRSANPGERKTGRVR